MFRYGTPFVWVCVVALTLFFFVNCSKEAFSSTPASALSAGSHSGSNGTLGTPSNSGTGTVTVGSGTTSPAICNPFGGTATNAENYLLADGVYYVEQSLLSASQDNDAFIDSTVLNNTVESFFNPANAYIGHVATPITMSQIDIPSMYFTQGFSDTNNDTLKDASGDLLLEYFGLRLTGQFVLGDWAPGNYEIATLTDDGSILTLTGGASDGTDFVINNDGHHALTMGCSAQTLTVNATSKIPIQFDYFQGPRYTIGLVMLYRPVPPAGSPQSDPLCGRGGDPYFFQDYDDNTNTVISPAKALPPYLQLTGPYQPSTGTGGWKVVESSHFIQPAGSAQISCH